MIRPATVEDQPALLALASATEMFSEEELRQLAQMLSDYFDGSLGDGHAWLVDEDQGVQAAAYHAPELMAYGVSNLLFLGVLTEQRRRGRAAALLAYVEDLARRRGDRLLIVETSGLDQFAPARQLYRKHGFDEEARIREFYNAGEDKVVFRKVLTAR